MFKRLKKVTTVILGGYGQDGNIQGTAVWLAVAANLFLSVHPVFAQQASIPASKSPSSANPTATNGITITSWTGMESNPRYLDVEINGKRVSAVFVPGGPDCYCPPRASEKVGNTDTSSTRILFR